MKLTARAAVGTAAAALATTVAATPAHAVPAQYVVDVVSCAVDDADTDSRAEMRLIGDIPGGWLRLERGEIEQPEHDHTDTYTFTFSQRLGPIREVDLAVDYHGDPWCIEKVVVRGPDGVTVHPFHNWVRHTCTKAFPLRLQAAR